MSDNITMNEVDLFELRQPEHLFSEIQKAMVEYYSEPNSRLLLFLLFSLNHLREWIAGAGYEFLEEKRRSGQTLLPREKLYFCLWEMEEFKIINSLCNRSKHVSVRRGGALTSVTSGFTCESPCNDSLDQTYYRIDGVDSRDIFLPVLRQYHDWFASIS
jgi:hypothetical protein